MAQNVAVIVRKGDLNRALKIFKRKVSELGILEEYKSKQEYIKPTTKRREAKKAAKRAQQLEVIKNKPKAKI
jgi:ribosomal protein S21